MPLDHAPWAVLGHAYAVAALEASLRAGRLAHAYLLTGLHGVGKTTFARALAQRLLCAHPDRQPCGECGPCRKVARGVHPDLRLVEGVPPRWEFDKRGFTADPRKHDRERRTLRVEQVRHLTHWLSQSPYESRWKIAVLRRFEEANEEAANALLKTLEEPPSYALLLLTASDPGGLLPTILSRCQKLALRPVPEAEIDAALRARWSAAPEQAALLARLACGRLGWAVRALEDKRVLEEREEALDQMQEIMAEGRAERLQRAVELAKRDTDLPLLLEQWLSWWRDILLLQVHGPVTNLDRLDPLQNAATRYSPSEAEQALQALRAAQRHLAQNVYDRLALDVLMLDLPPAR